MYRARLLLRECLPWNTLESVCLSRLARSTHHALVSSIGLSRALVHRQRCQSSGPRHVLLLLCIQLYHIILVLDTWVSTVLWCVCCASERAATSSTVTVTTTVTVTVIDRQSSAEGREQWREREAAAGCQDFKRVDEERRGKQTRQPKPKQHRRLLSEEGSGCVSRQVVVEEEAGCPDLQRGCRPWQETELTITTTKKTCKVGCMAVSMW